MPSRQVTIHGVLTWDGPEGPVDPGWGRPGVGYPGQGLPIAPGRPDQGLPPFQGYPGQGLPPSPGRPDQGLPPSPGHPGQGLPWFPGRPDQGQPPQYPTGGPIYPGGYPTPGPIPGEGRPDNSLPGVVGNMTPMPEPPEDEGYTWFQSPGGWVVGVPTAAPTEPSTTPEPK